MPDDEIQEIIKLLRERKVASLKPYLDALKKGVPLKPIDQDELLKKESTETKIKTGTLIDEIIGGGLPPSSEDAVSSMLLYGEYGSGKTQTCFTMTVECSDDVIYIDAEGSYRAERIKEIAEARGKNWDEVKKKIHLFRPTNWIEQMMVLNSLPSPADTHTGKIGLIIVDSLTKAFRGVEFAGRQFLTVKQPLIREFIFQIETIVKSYESALILTTQISISPQANPFLPVWTGHKPVGGPSVLHQPAFVIFFRRAGGNTRIAQMMDSSWKPLRERPFLISNKGIQDIPEDAEMRERLMKKAEAFEERQRQERKIIPTIDNVKCKSCQCYRPQILRGEVTDHRCKRGNTDRKIGKRLIQKIYKEGCGDYIKKETISEEMQKAEGVEKVLTNRLVTASETG